MSEGLRPIRDQHITLSLTMEEKQSLERQAGRLSLPVAAWIRHVSCRLAGEGDEIAHCRGEAAATEAAIDWRP